VVVTVWAARTPTVNSRRRNALARVLEIEPIKFIRIAKL
jgi:hypothetical protein